MPNSWLKAVSLQKTSNKSLIWKTRKSHVGLLMGTDRVGKKA